jgi:histone-binding protein RBBP4
MNYRDCREYTSVTKVIKPYRTYTHHSDIVNDVQYHPLHTALLGTVSDDCSMQIIDVRSKDLTRAAVKTEEGHTDAVNALAFNPAAEFNVVTGSADKSIGVWDLRNLKWKVHALEGHKDSVTGLSWHPFEEGVLASSSYDRRIIFWDLSKVGEEQTPDDAEDGPPEL